MEKGKNGNIVFVPATVMDLHKIVYMWIKMREEFSDPVESLLDRDQREVEFFYRSLMLKVTDERFKNGNIVIIAFYKTEPIGFGLADVQVLDNSSHWLGYCREIYVKEKFRKRGIEVEIRRTLIEELKKRKVSKILYVVEYNDKIIESYQKKGFVPIKITFIKEESDG